jgi:hypothetical protein
MERPEIETSSKQELKIRQDIVELFKQAPIPDHEVLENLPLFIKRRDLMRILFMNELYKKILEVHGVILEFGVRWGKNMALYESFRGMYEPFNHSRRIIGFDTFEGFPSVHSKDGKADLVKVGTYSVSKGYENYLEKVLDYHEHESPISHLKKFELYKGDAIVELEKYLKAHPETIIALAYFDFDIYEPTRKCLEMIKPHLTRGSVLGFDELSVPSFPGETVALREVFGIDKFKVRRNMFSSVQSYVVVE